MAGEIIAVGEDAGSEWKKGDRVCANFAADHIAGETSVAIQKTAHGGQIHGVLTQYKSFRPHVCLLDYCKFVLSIDFLSEQSLVRIPEHLSYEEASTLP